MGKNTLIKMQVLLLGLLIVVPSLLLNAQNVPFVQSIDFYGNLVLTKNQLLTSIDTKKGNPYSESILIKDLEQILALYKERAYLHAKIDSVSSIQDTLLSSIDIKIYLSEGKPSVLRKLEFTGCKNLSTNDLLAVMQLRENDLFIPSVLESDIEAILKLYELKSYPLAKVSVENILFNVKEEESSVKVQLNIDEGNSIRVTEIKIEGNRITKDYVITREARLSREQLFQSDLLEKIKRRLDRLQLFSSVSLPELYLIDSEKAGLLLRVAEGNQNSFDGVLGYVPANGSNEKGYFTGLINLSFKNLFGTGRKLSARWYQENRLSHETELHYFEPWIASYPVNLQLGFYQRKQDSIFVRMQYDISAELMIIEDFILGVSFLQQNVYPTKGYGQLVVAESETRNYGLSVRYDSRDNPVTPTEGFLYTTEYKTGTKNSSSTILHIGNIKSTTSRLMFDLSYYISPFLRQVIASELHLRDVRNSNLDMSDLFQVGGASTLRGYREGQFLGSRILWTNLEYRFLVAQRSFFYCFVDIGYIFRPEDKPLGILSSEQNKIGYGIGIRMDSALGLIGVSFAMGEGDTFSTSKIHFRLINEF